MPLYLNVDSLEYFPTSVIDFLLNDDEKCLFHKNVHQQGKVLLY